MESNQINILWIDDEYDIWDSYQKSQGEIITLSYIHINQKKRAYKQLEKTQITIIAVFY